MKYAKLCIVWPTVGKKRWNLQQLSIPRRGDLNFCISGTLTWEFWKWKQASRKPQLVRLEDIILNTMKAGKLCNCYTVKPAQEWWVLLLAGEREFAIAISLSPATLEQKGWTFLPREKNKTNKNSTPNPLPWWNLTPIKLFLVLAISASALRLKRTMASACRWLYVTAGKGLSATRLSSPCSRGCRVFIPTSRSASTSLNKAKAVRESPCGISLHCHQWYHAGISSLITELGQQTRELLGALTSHKHNNKGPERPTVTLTWHASKNLQKRYIQVKAQHSPVSTKHRRSCEQQYLHTKFMACQHQPKHTEDSSDSSCLQAQATLVSAWPQYRWLWEQCYLQASVSWNKAKSWLWEQCYLQASVSWNKAKSWLWEQCYLQASVSWNKAKSWLWEQCYLQASVSWNKAKSWLWEQCYLQASVSWNKAKSWLWEQCYLQASVSWNKAKSWLWEQCYLQASVSWNKAKSWLWEQCYLQASVSWNKAKSWLWEQCYLQASVSWNKAKSWLWEQCYLQASVSWNKAKSWLWEQCYLQASVSWNKAKSWLWEQCYLQASVSWNKAKSWLWEQCYLQASVSWNKAKSWLWEQQYFHTKLTACQDSINKNQITDVKLNYRASTLREVLQLIVFLQLFFNSLSVHYYHHCQNYNGCSGMNSPTHL